MPLYGYACDTCGSFKDWRTMSAASEPAICPKCGQAAPRTISAPFISNMNPNSRIAHQRNEKSAHEPEVETRKTHSHDSQAHPHRHGRLGHGRPWMIGH